MAVWSTLIRSAGPNLQKTRLLLPKCTTNNAILNPVQLQARNMSHNMVITASKWQWHKTKDLLHFYIMVAAIPLSVITIIANIFVGPAELTPIPEGYEPKHWEYYRNPITRFLARYVYTNPQKEYERILHVIYDEQELVKIRALEKQVWKYQGERQDYKYKFFLPYGTHQTREFRETVKRHNDNME